MSCLVKSYIPAIVLMIALGVAGAAPAAKLGDPAKPVSIAEWVKGGPVDTAAGKGKNFYVVEFWATYCPPCLKSIPHLTELQKTYKDKGLVVIGVSNEPAETVKPFVTEQGAKMEYAVGLDKDFQTSKGYMELFGYNGIPTAFVVDKQGALAWHGSPFDPMFDRVIAKLADGTFDLAALEREQQAVKERQTHFRRYFELAASGEDNKAADSEAAWMMSNGADDMMLMRSIAMSILFTDTLKYRDKALAMRTARKAFELTQGSDPAALHAYARALFDDGKVDDAIKYQKQAVTVNTNEQIAAELKATLAKYEDSKTSGAPEKAK